MLRGGVTKVTRERTAGDRQGFFYSEISFPTKDVGWAEGSATLYYMLDSPKGKGGGLGGNGGPLLPLPLPGLYSRRPCFPRAVQTAAPGRSAGDRCLVAVTRL